MANRWGNKQWKQCHTSFLGTPKSLQVVTASMKLKDICSLEENCDQPRQHIKMQRYYFANKDLSSQSYGFPVVTYGCESWTIKKAECRRINAFELSCWRRFLRVPWTARRSTQSIPKEISPEYSLEGLMLELKLQYFGHLMRRANWLEKTMILGKIDSRKRRRWQRMIWLDVITDSMDLSLSQLWEMVKTGKPGVLQFTGSQRVRQLCDWTTNLSP